MKFSEIGYQALVAKFGQFTGHRLFGPGLLALVIKVSSAGLSFLMYVVFAHAMSADDYGKFAFSFNLAIVAAAVASFGYPTGILRYWAKYIADGKLAEAKGAMVLGLRLSLIGSTALVVLAGATSLILPNAAHNYLAIAALAMAIGLSDLVANILRAMHHTFSAMFPRDVAWRLASMLAAVIAIIAGYQLSDTVGVYLSASLLALLIIPQIYIALHDIKVAVGTAKPIIDWAGISPSLMPLWGAGAIYAIIQQFDVVIVGSLLSGPETGAYFAAQKTATLLSLVLIAGGLVTAPIMAKMFHDNKMVELQKLCRQLVAAIAVVTLLGLVFLIFAGNPLLRLFSPSFTADYWIMIILAMGCLVDSVSGSTSYLMQMTAYEKPYLKIMVVCYAVVLVLQFALIPRFGAYGAAFASASGTIIWNVWAVWFLRVKAGIDPSILSLVWPIKHVAATK